MNKMTQAKNEWSAQSFWRISADTICSRASSVQYRNGVSRNHRKKNGIRKI